MSADLNSAAAPIFALSNGGGLAKQDDQFYAVPVLKQYLHTVIRWKWVVIGTIAACLILGLIVTLLTAPSYTASSQIEINREQKKVTNVEGLNSAQEGQDFEFYETQYALLRAPSLAARVAKKLDLAHNLAFFAAAGISPETGVLGSAKGVALTGPQRTQLKSRERLAINLLLGHIAIEPIRRSRLVKVGFTSRSPDMSALIANAWTQEFIGASMDRQFAATADARNFLEGRLAALKIKLGESERETVTYATSKGIVALDSVRDAQGKATGQGPDRAPREADRGSGEGTVPQSVGDGEPGSRDRHTIVVNRSERRTVPSGLRAILVRRCGHGVRQPGGGDWCL